MAKILYKAIVYIVLAFALFVFLLYVNNGIGISSSRFETDIRKSQKIEDSWTFDGSFNNNMAAFISYPSDMSDHTFSVYVNRSGLSFGYFFRGGGSLPNITESIAEISVSACNDRAYISMNVQNVQRVEIDDGRNKQVMEIDSNKPFAIVLPSNTGIVSFYDVSGNKVTYFEESL